MSYAKQVLCYMCSEIAAKAAAAKPDAAQCAAYQIKGDWTKIDWIEDPNNYNAWASFSKARILNGIAPRLVGDWIYSVEGHSNGEAETDLGGTYPRVTKAGNLTRLKSAAVYHWLLASGAATPNSICDATFRCSKTRANRWKHNGWAH